MESVEDLRQLVARNANGRLELNLSKRGLRRVPEAVSLLTEVEVLDLSDNPITDIPESLTKLIQLKALLCKNCKLRSLTILPQLTTLETLDLSGTRISNLQEYIVQLKGLKILSLCGCGLTEIAVNLCQLTSLEELDLSENPIKTLPQAFSHLKQLKRLEVRDCGLTEVGAVITQLTSLEELYLSRNPIKTLPQAFSHLKQLKRLEVRDCGLTEVGAVITQLTSLEELDLSNNPIKTLPQAFSHLKQLKRLEVRDCGLTEVGAVITQLTSLEELYLSRNPIKTLHQAFSHLNQLKKLDLYNCGLTEVGAVITQLTSLEELDLSNNPIKTLPQAFSHLKQLKRLEVRDCGLTEVGAVITQLTSLEELYLSRNPIKTLHQAFSHLNQLKKLDLYNCGLTEVGAVITQLTSLEELYLSCNPIKTLPQAFSHLKQLKKLEVWDCGLTEVGAVITQLTSLQELNLSNNPIKTLPQAFSHLKQLKKLHLSYCGLTEVGADITQLTSLEELDLSRNPIKTLHQAFSHLNQLKKLDLYNCGLTEVGAVITQLTSLEELYLLHNPIKTLPQAFSHLKQLKKLDLYNCGLTEVGAVITQLTSLQELNLSNNPIKTLPQAFSHLKQLKKLEVWHCGLTEVGAVITQLTSLQELNLSNNPIKTLPQAFSHLKQLKKLEVWHCGLTEVGAVITQLTSLEELDLSRNPIKTLPQAFSHLKQLKKLELRYCGLTEVGAVITQLSSLEELNLSENPIKTLPRALSHLKQLKKLEVHNCGLTEAGAVITQLTSLEELNLSWNPIKTLPQALSLLKQLKQLEVHGNPLTIPPHEVCGQGVQAIFSYFAEIRMAKAVHQKVVLLGCSGAGKTSLVKTLVNKKPSCVRKDDRTIVLDRIIWEPTIPDQILSVCVIDFGGNDWYKIVHHLFIEENALFLLVVNLAHYCCENFNRDIGNWMKLLLTRVPNANLRLVSTHADKCTQEDIQSKCEDIKERACCIYEREGLKVEEALEIRVVSSENMRGILNLHEELISFICEEGKVIPLDWLELYKNLQSSEVKGRPYVKFKDVEELDQEVRKGSRRWEKKGTLVERKFTRVQSSLAGKKEEIPDDSSRAELAFDSKSRLQTVLKFFHAIGSILWYQNTPELSQLIFHKPEYLTDLLKAIFTERLETESLSCDKNFKSTFTAHTFQQAKEDVLQQGIMSRDLLWCLWKQNVLEEDVFPAMIDLFMHLDFCYSMHTDQEGRVTSLRFPWFLVEKVPEDPEVQQILFGPPAVKCYRIAFEYEFLAICPPPMYEKFAVCMDRRIPDKKSRTDWKDGFFARIFRSRVLVQKFHRDMETVISFAVEGDNVPELWTVLKILKEAMQEVMREWRGVKLGSHYNTFLLCPHCVHQCVKKPSKFPGENAETECPESQLWMTCKRNDQVTDVPACLVFHVKDSSFHQEHKDVLQKFVSEVEKDIHDGVKLVGYVKETYSALGDGFLRNLLEHSRSVGIIKSKHADGRQSSTGTVFRIGSHFVLTNLHVVQSIAECAGGVEYLGDRGSVFVSFNYRTPEQHGEPLVELFLHPQFPKVWENGPLDAAVLQLDTQRMPLDYQLPAPLGHLHADARRSTTLNFIGHEARGEHNRFLDLLCPVKKFSDLSPEFREENRDIVFDLSDPRRTLLSSSLTHGSSGSPGFDNYECLVVMYTKGYPEGISQVEQAVNIVAIKEQMRSESPQFAELAELLFPPR